ncbi:hypothetical protein ABZX12_07620 [Kribbella sp. NPDC003505]|uniref:hypothetical protein n=1 Tax=Kribbella sp. NPDC003505 TaxID=3154448 RepID=UPI0033BB8F15
MSADAADRYRVVIDEDSLNWCGRSGIELASEVDNLSDILQPLTVGKHVGLMDHAYEIECWESVHIYDLHGTHNLQVPRDTRLRLAKLIDKCRLLHPEDRDIPQQVEIGGLAAERSFGFCHALALAAEGHAMSTLIASSMHENRGWLTVRRELEPTDLELHLLTSPNHIPDFWRGVLRREASNPEKFFELAPAAFPNLIFAEALNFGRFSASYTEVLPWLLITLEGINDHFADSLARHQGDRNKVIQDFAGRGLDVSPESPSTHKDTQAWNQRLVRYRKLDYRCEWHGKRLWNRDRVHFSLPIASYGGKILVGIFADHLD